LVKRSNSDVPFKEENPMNLDRRICAALFAAITAFGATAAHAAALTKVGDLQEASRPAGIPLDYVVTPNGLFHASCVVKVEENDLITANGDVRHADGSVREATVCAYARFDRAGKLIAFGGRDEANPPPAFDGWVASSNSDYNVTPPAKKMVADFTVPSGPRTAAGQVLYFFPGLEATINLQTILQPVLAWNGFGDSAWTMTNWNCCKNGTTFHGDTIAVKTGHKIHGAMKGNSCQSGVCSNWNITSIDKSTGQKTTFGTDAYDQAFNWYFGGVMEVYGVSQCSQYPANGSIRFTDVRVYNLNNGEVTPSNWNTGIASTAPACNYAVAPTRHTTTITFDSGP
jgi:hypothetical protein